MRIPNRGEMFRTMMPLWRSVSYVNAYAIWWFPCPVHVLFVVDKCLVKMLTPYVYEYVCTFVSSYVCMNMSLCACECVLYVWCTYVCAYACTHICVCMYVCMYVCVCIYVLGGHTKNVCIVWGLPDTIYANVQAAQTYFTDETFPRGEIIHGQEQVVHTWMHIFLPLLYK